MIENLEEILNKKFMIHQNCLGGSDISKSEELIKEIEAIIEKMTTEKKSFKNKFEKCKDKNVKEKI